VIAGLRPVPRQAFGLEGIEGENARGNVRQDELQGFREFADAMLSYGEATLAKALERGALQEVKADEQDLSK
jgi:hypothetical protein